MYEYQAELTRIVDGDTLDCIIDIGFSVFVKKRVRLHGIDTWERSLEFVTEFLGEDVLLFATDWPHGDTAWPSAVDQVVEWPRLTENAKRKILGGNAQRLCPRILS